MEVKVAGVRQKLLEKHNKPEAKVLQGGKTAKSPPNISSGVSMLMNKLLINRSPAFCAATGVHIYRVHVHTRTCMYTNTHTHANTHSEGSPGGDNRG